MKVRLVEQKGVMALVGVDLDEAHVGARAVERARDGAALRRREQPVGAERDEQEARARAPERLREIPALVGREVEIVHRAGHGQIGVGVEAAHEGAALVLEIALNLEAPAEQRHDLARVLRRRLQLAAELAGQRLLGEIGDVRAHARHPQPARRDRAGLPVAPALPVRIGENRLTAHLMKCDVLRRVVGRGCDRQRGKHRIRVVRRPLQRLHPAHRSADHREQPRNPEMRDESLLRPHHVADGHGREIRAPQHSGAALARAAGAGAAHAPAQDVGADHEIPLGVHRPPWPHHRVPPAGLSGQGVALRHVLVAGQGVADQHRVAPRRVQRSIRPIRDRHAPEPRAAVERHSVLEGDVLVAPRP
jgi:hypothetical protein